MAARTTQQVLEQLERFLPERFQALRPVLGNLAAQLRTAEASAVDLADSVTVEGAEGVFLTTLARGYGVERSPGETDESVRSRLRNVEGQVTRPDIIAAVQRLFAPYTDEEPLMIEWWEEPYWDASFLDYAILVDGPNCFVLFLPAVGDRPTSGAYWDASFYDAATPLGDGVTHPVYLATIGLVNRIKAAGVRWAAHINYDGALRG